MSINPVVKQVTEKINESEALANAALNRLSTTDLQDPRVAIRDLFPETTHLASPHWSNIARGFSLPHHLLVGGPAVVDLKPVSADRFEATYGVGTDEMLYLLDHGWLIGNIYFRNPNSWLKDADTGNELDAAYLLPILRHRHTIPNGTRTDAYLARLAPGYGDTQRKKEEDFSVAYDRASVEMQATVKTLTYAKPDADSSAKITAARQWAYIAYVDMLLPGTLAEVDDLVAQGKLGEAVVAMRMIRRAALSRYTAAIGGEFIWGNDDFEQWSWYRTVAQPLGAVESALRTRQSSEVELAFRIRPEVFEYLVEEFGTIPGLEVSNQIPVPTLMAVHNSPDWTTYRRTLLEALTRLSRRVPESSAQMSSSVDDLRNCVLGMRDMAQTYQISAAAILGSGPPVLAKGIFGDPFWAALFTVACKYTAEGFGSKLGDLFFRFFQPDDHRILADLTKIERILRDTEYRRRGHQSDP